MLSCLVLTVAPRGGCTVTVKLHCKQRRDKVICPDSTTLGILQESVLLDTV